MSATTTMRAVEHRVDAELEMARAGFHMAMATLNKALTRFAETGAEADHEECKRRYEDVQEARAAESTALQQHDHLRFTLACATIMADHKEAE